MIRQIVLASLVVGWVATGSSARAQDPTSESAYELYQRALVAEQAVGDLSEAIELYRQVATTARGNRDLAARALVHAAQALEKLGQQESLDLYVEVIATYPEQTASVALARTRLEALGSSGGQSGSPSIESVRTDVSGVMDAVLSTYCIDCHNAQTAAGRFSIDSVNTLNVADDPELWESVLGRLRARTMPPFGRDRPDRGSHQRIISTLELALDQAYPVPGQRALATDSELAARLAAFLWGSGPDQLLIDAAAAGQLRNPSVLEAQVRRMLGDTRSSHLVEDFFEQSFWPLGRLETMEVDPSLIPPFDESLRQAFRQETRLFFESQVQGDRPAMEVWNADYTFLNERLARHYDIPGVAGNEFRRVELTDTVRGGLLGQGSILTISSFNGRTSPTSRGKAILENFFGQTPPDPPPGVTALPEDSRPVSARLADHLTNPACATCHVMFDPLGTALENFDATGRWRTSDSGTPIDASGQFIDGTGFNGLQDFRTALTGYRDPFVTHVTASLLTYALGRDPGGGGPYPYEMPVVREIVRGAAASEYRWSALVLGVIRSDPFQSRTIVP